MCGPDPARPAAVLVVAFGSAPGVPNWGKLLDLVAASMAEADGVPFDVLFVADPFRQWGRGPVVPAGFRPRWEADPMDAFPTCVRRFMP